MPDQLEDQDPGQLRPFAAWLQEHRKGSLHAELSEQIAAVAAAVIEHQDKGELTVKISFKPNKDGVSMSITDEIKAKVPQPDRGASIFFADDAGNLTRNDPRQQELPALRGVPGSGSTTDSRSTGS